MINRLQRSLIKKFKVPVDWDVAIVLFVLIGVILLIATFELWAPHDLR
jgi:hypothetical protein